MSSKYGRNGTSVKETNALLIESSQEPSIKPQSRRKTILIAFFIFILIAVIIIVAVAVSASDDNEGSFTRESNAYYEEKFMSIPSNDSCYEYSHQFAEKPHVAGMAATLEIGNLFATIMEDLGYDAIRDNIPNAVLDHYNNSQLFINGQEIDLSQEPIPGQPETNVSFRERSWIAYSASGHHIAPILYVNNGNAEDYDFLVNDLSIDLDNDGVGFIGLAKRGSRPDQALQAGLRGLKGLILFEDNYRSNPGNEYPKGPQMPNFGFRIDGRIRQNPGCTGNPDINRLSDQCGLNTSEYEDLFPAIKYNLSMIMISPNTAINLFEIMNEFSNDTRCDDILSNADWQSNLPINTCVGGDEVVTAELVTENDMHFDDTIQNVYGYIKGSDYPDEIIMIGAHRDAWGMGACDDISGTVTILEVARSLSVLRREYGWRPKRSIMFGSWDGEEWGLYGSVDFNEVNERTNEYIDNIVAYFNFDMTVVGGSLSLQGNPILRKFMLETAEQVQYPYPDSEQNNDGSNSTNFTLFDSWWNFDESAPNNLPTSSCGSDFCAFEYHSGIATLGAGIGGAGPAAYTYHTFYDLNGWLDLVDPKWKFAQSMATYAGLMVLKFAQQDLIPFDIPRIGMKLQEWANVDLQSYASASNCALDAEYIGSLIDVVNEFANATNIFEDYYQETLEFINGNGTKPDGYDVEENIKNINGILKGFMRGLTLKYPQGLPSNKWWKQLLFAPGGKRFPFIWDLIQECNEEDLSNAFEITINAIKNATDLLASL